MNETLEPPREEPLASYYGRPLLKRPHWEWNVVAYLFAGGIMGGSGMIAAFAGRGDDEGDRALARNAKVTSLLLAAACPALLVSHLGRPERFAHMLRVVKFKSPMSLGVWGLIAFSGIAGFNLLVSLRRPRTRFFDLPQALLGAYIAGYTGVLISATAIPLWAKGKYHIPAMCVFSGVAGACALHRALLPRRYGRTHERLERLGTFAGLCEGATIAHLSRYARHTGDPMFRGARGAKLRTLTFGAGVVLPILLRPRSRGALLLAAVLTLVGGYVLRETLIEAGKRSADDPSQAFVQPE